MGGGVNNTPQKLHHRSHNVNSSYHQSLEMALTLWILLSAALGEMVCLVAMGEFLRYMRDVMSANIYETGVVYEYSDDFTEDEHTHFHSEVVSMAVKGQDLEGPTGEQGKTMGEEGQEELKWGQGEPKGEQGRPMGEERKEEGPKGEQGIQEGPKGGQGIPMVEEGQEEGQDGPKGEQGGPMGEEEQQAPRVKLREPTVTQGNREELDRLRHFVRNEVIPKFRHQRDHVNGGNQFSLLLLLEEPLADSLSSEWNFKPLTDRGTPCVDSRYSTRPPRDLYENYVVARPQLHRVHRILRRLLFYKVPEVFYEHSEVMLVNEFDALWGTFEARRGGTPKVVIVFSWLFPCDRCTSELVKKLGCEFREQHPAVQRVILAFVIFWHRMPFEENWKNFKRLQADRFDVVRVKYITEE